MGAVTSPKRVVVRRRVRRVYWRSRDVGEIVRRWLFVRRALLSAKLRNSKLDLHVAPDVFVGRGARIEVFANSDNRVVIGSETRINENVIIWVDGGTVEIGSRTGIRRGAVINCQGHVVLGDDIVFSWGAMIHCAERVEIGDGTIIGEYTTIADSVHLRTPVDLSPRDYTRTRPIRIGRSVWLAAQVIVAPGVTIGDGAVVGGGGVVTKDVAPMWFVGGNPAQPIRELEVEDPRLG
jgi:acetyltransferase-like isoleucine patch superfamily enzyme